MKIKVDSPYFNKSNLENMNLMSNKSSNEYLKILSQNYPLDSITNSKQKEILNENIVENIKKINIKIENENIIYNAEKKINFKELFMDGLSQHFLNLFNDNSKLFYSKYFLEGICNEYGLIGKSINKDEAFKIYKEGADSKNEYLCMYRLHKIFSEDYKDFNLEKKNDLDKLYLFKCFAYLPYSILNGNYFIFNKINITYDIAVYLDNEDPSFEKFDNFMQMLDANKSLYNLSINDIKLMKLVFKTYFDSSKYINNIGNLFKFLDLEKDDDAYYEAQLKYCNFYLEYFKNNCDKSKIKEIYENLIKSKYYKASFDFGKFMISEEKYDEAKNIIKNGLDNQNQFCLAEYSYILLKDIELNQILSDYKIIKDILNHMFLSVCLEKLNYSSVFYAIYYLTKHSSNKKEIENDFINLIIEIYNNFEKNIKSIDDSKYIYDERYILEIPFIFGQMCYYGISDHIKSDKKKALIFFKKSYKLSKEKKYIYYQRINYIYIYKSRKHLFKNQNIKEEKLNKTKNKLHKIFINSEINHLTSFELYNYYNLYKNENNENMSKKQIIVLLKKGNNFKMTYNFKDYIYKEKCNIALKQYENIVLNAIKIKII